MAVKKLASLVVDLEARTAKFERGMDKAQKKATKFGSSMKSLGGVLVGALAGRQLLRSFQAIADAAIAGEQSMAKVEAIIRATGGVAGVTADQVNRLASSMASLTLFDDDSIRDASAVMLTFKDVTTEVFDDAMKAVVDMSAALGQDLQQGVIQLGKALNDPKTGMAAMRRVGVSFSEAQIQMARSMVDSNNIMGAQKIILKELQSEFGGTAQAMNVGMAAGITNLKKAWVDLLEVLGRTAVFATIADAMQGLAFRLSTDVLDVYLRKNLELVEQEERLARLEQARGEASASRLRANQREYDELIARVAALRIAVGRARRDMGGSRPFVEAGGGSRAPAVEARRGPGVRGIVTLNEAELTRKVHHAAASVETLLDVAIQSEKRRAEESVSAAKKMNRASDWVLQGFDEMATAAGIFQDQTAQLVVRGIGAMIEALGGSSKFLTSLGQGLQSFQTGGVVRGPIGSPQLAMVHGGERVLPRGASAAQAVTVNQVVNFNISAVDGQSVARFVDQNRNAIAGGVARAAQEAPGLARALRG